MAFTTKEHQEYNKKRASHLIAHPFCEVSKAHGHATVPATRVHHKRGRKRYYLDESTFVSVSKWGDAWIHSNTNMAKEMGLLEL